MFAEAAATLLVLAQAGPDRPDVAKVALEEAQRHYQSCLESSAAQIDDGHSDEAVIADKIANDCLSHFEVYLSDLKEVHPDDHRTGETIKHAFALRVVHEAREAAAFPTVVD